MIAVLPWIAAVVVAGGAAGLLIGSFLNVVVHRVPAGMSVVAPPSACPGCGSRIGARDNVPVLSWIALRGRCRSCREPISARYPLVEMATGLFFVFVVVRFWPLDPAAAGIGELIARLPVLLAFLWLAAVSVALALIDLDVHDVIVLPSYGVGIVMLGLGAWASGDWASLGRAAAGAGVLYALYLVMALVMPGGMGFGDVKLAGVLGLYLGWLGWGSLAVGAFSGFLLGGLFAVALVALRRASRGGGIPFGPWMLAGAWTGIFFGSAVFDAYLSAIGLASAGA
jgi:leader peptidase (prepilin peptidase)/N-methyltransferase